MNINIYLKSKIKDKNLKKAVDEYVKRLSRYCKIKIKILKKKDSIEELAVSSPFSINIRNTEKSLKSEEFAQLISGLGIKGISTIDFFFTEEKAEFFDENICLTYLDFSEDFDLMILTEQIYRAFRIINGEPYHK